MAHYIRFLLLTIVLLAANVPTGDEAIATEACTIEEGMTFEDWQSWQKLTHKPIFSEGHGKTWVDIYVNELAEEIYRNVSGPYPVCAKIMGEVLPI